MDTFYKLAGNYYYRFFGAHLLPRWNNWRYLLCFSSFALFGLSTFWLTADQTPPIQGAWLVLLIALAVLGLVIACASTRAYASRQEQANCDAPMTLSASERLRIAKRKHLSELTGRPSSEFLAVVNEIENLQTLEKTYRTAFDPDLWRTLRKLSDPQLITSVISMALSALAIFISIVDKNALLEVIGTFDNKEYIEEAADFLKISVFFFVIAVLFFIFLRKILEIIILLASGFSKKKMGNKPVLNCFIRDLINLHTPSQVVLKSPHRKLHASPTPTPRPFVSSKMKTLQKLKKADQSTSLKAHRS